MPGVAVIIAAKDAASTIGRAIRSALVQPEVTEVIVVDDASSDDTSSVARQADDGSARLRVLRLDRNAGPSVARNLALDHSQAGHVAVLDADDFLLPGRFARLLAQSDGGGEEQLLADDLLVARAGEEDGPHATLYFTGPAEPLHFDLAAFAQANLSSPTRPRGELGFLKPLISRDFLNRHGLRYDPAVRLGEDYLLYASALARGARLRLVGACGYVAVRRAESLSHRHETEDLRRFAEAAGRLATLPGLPAAAVAALREHGRGVTHRFLHRAVLDAKRRRDYAGAARLFLHSPAATRYIITQTIRDKLRRV